MQKKLQDLEFNTEVTSTHKLNDLLDSLFATSLKCSHIEGARARQTLTTWVIWEALLNLWVVFTTRLRSGHFALLEQKYGDSKISGINK